MDSAAMHEYFNVLIDKQGGAYFDDTDRDRFINMAQIEYVKELLPSNEGGAVNLEFDHVNFHNIQPLVYQTAGLSANSSGEITTASVQTALNTASSSTEPYMYVMNVSWTKSGATYPVKFTRHNDFYEIELNSFKQGKSTRPRYRHLGTKFVFSPIDTSASIKFTLLKQPVDVELNVTDCELPSHTHKKITEMAVDLAILSLRDSEYSQLKK